jgi:hypothetical protein
VAKPFSKDFTEIIKFTPIPDAEGEQWFPIVEISIVKATGRRIPLQLLFDTGATQIIIRADHSHLFTGLEDAWFNTSYGKVKGKIAKGQTIEFLGVTTTCDIGLLPNFPEHVFVGLFGRDCFSPFGFGFWESAHELYVTLKPKR